MAEKLGITQQSYAQIESNLHSTSVERLYMILRLLKVELSFSSSGATASGNFVGISDLSTKRATNAQIVDGSESQQKRGILRQEVKGTTVHVKKGAAKKNAPLRSTSPVAVKQSDKTKW